MKNYKLPLMGIVLVLATASCKKEDVQHASNANSISSSKNALWKSIDSWSNSKTDSTDVTFSRLTDSSITADVVKEGFVLVFKKMSSEIQALPLLERNDKTYWYYQVSKGSLRINSDNNTGENLSEQSFSYFVVTPEQLAILETKGKTKLDLLQLTYDEAIVLFK